MVKKVKDEKYWEEFGKKMGNSGFRWTVQTFGICAQWKISTSKNGRLMMYKVVVDLLLLLVED